LTLLLIGQLSMETNQTTLNFRQWMPFNIRYFNRPNVAYCAIQHANYSVKCIAESKISGRFSALKRKDHKCHAGFVTS